MIRRRIERVIRASLRQFPVVGLVGSRQVGKTTIARAIARGRPKSSLYLDLERPSDLARIQDPEFYLEQHRRQLVILDEVQRLPELFPVMRALVDSLDRPGRFLVLGSASPDLRRQSAESLAGRIVYHGLSPLSLDEIGRRSWRRLWLRGGYPVSFQARSDLASKNWRAAFIQTYLERDLPQLGVRVPAAQLRRFWEMLAHVHGQLLNASALASSLGVSAPTVRHYLDILQDTFLVRELQPWFVNVRKRLVKAPKVYLRDSGLLHALLGIDTLDELQAHPVAGRSFEGWAMEQVMAQAEGLAAPHFYRTHAGTEVDLVLVRDGAPALLVEFKLGLAPQASRGLREAMSDLRCGRAFIVYPGSRRHRLAEGIEALPLSDLEAIREALSGVGPPGRRRRASRPAHSPK